MKKASRLSKGSISVFLSTCAVVLTACGGSGPEPYLANQEGADGAAATTTSGYTGGSSGLNSFQEFEGFNPSIWNEHAWYECNCGINPNTPPAVAPQDGLLLGNQR